MDQHATNGGPRIPEDITEGDKVAKLFSLHHAESLTDEGLHPSSPNTSKSLLIESMPIQVWCSSLLFHLFFFYFCLAVTGQFGAEEKLGQADKNARPV